MLYGRKGNRDASGHARLEDDVFRRKRLRCLSFEAYAYDMEVLATTQRERERGRERERERERERFTQNND